MLNATTRTQSRCGGSVKLNWPVATSHTRTSRSVLPVTTRLPSKLNAATRVEALAGLTHSANTFSF